ncbi:interaptin-like isoform X2 [Metopolophium dirhodum]|uniref:interaptin-like isoform X2 n=1 Tax=Metopolophium dirhodum TaxID=44670 RepID=UPI00298F9ECB|nr:interaptin-like isoform X2 [Metopolophium dirhodum]
MNEPERNARLLDVCDEIDKTTSSPNNTTFHSFNNTGITESVLENNGLCDSVKYLDFQRMMIDQNNVTMALKISEYEKVLSERDYTIKSLHTTMMNSQNNNYILNNQCKNIMEKTKSVNDTCIRLNTSFTNICERLNRLGDTVDNAKTRQKDVMTLVDQTTNTFQEKMLTISDALDESLKQVTMEKIRTKQDLEMLQDKYSLDVAAYKTNLQECTTEIEYLKNENNILLEKLNDSYIQLNEEKETLLKLNQCFETERREMENQNLLLINQNKSMNEKYDELRTKNQTLEDELNVLKTSLNENQKQLHIQSNIIKEQSELCDNLKIFEELNEKLKKDNFTLKEQNEYLEQINTNLVEDISSIKLSQQGIQEETENKFKDMCENYDNLLKMQDERLKDRNEKLALQKEMEIKNQTEVIELKEEIETSNKTITVLREELQANLVLIPELQNKIDGLNKNLVNAYQTLRDSTKELVTEKNELEKEKTDLENQSKEHFSQIEKLTANYMKYKSKAKQLYVEVMRLRYQCSRSEPKNKTQQLRPVDTIEILSDEDNNIDDDVSIIEFNDRNVSNMNVSIHSTSNKPFQKSNISSLKRNGSPLIHIGSSKVKKRITSVDVAASHKKNEYNVNINEDVDYNSAASPHQIKSNVSIGSNTSQVKSTLNAGLTSAAKKKFKIPADIKLSQKKIKPTNIKKTDWTKPNSPVVFTAPSPKLQPKFIK